MIRTMKRFARLDVLDSLGARNIASSKMGASNTVDIETVRVLTVALKCGIEVA